MLNLEVGRKDPNNTSGYWVPITKYKAFKVDNDGKYYCTKLIGADALFSLGTQMD